MNKLGQWNLGGDLVVLGTILPTGDHAVWYPTGVPGLPLEGLREGVGALVVFPKDDEEYVAPSYWTEETSLASAQVAVDVMGKYRVGDRVRLTDTLECYPHFYLAGCPTTGPVGTVSNITSEALWVKMDQHVPGAEDWDNEVAFYHAWGDEITLAVLGGGVPWAILTALGTNIACPVSWLANAPDHYQGIRVTTEAYVRGCASPEVEYALEPGAFANTDGIDDLTMCVNYVHRLVDQGYIDADLSVLAFKEVVSQGG